MKGVNNIFETTDRNITCGNIENRTIWHDMIEKIQQFFQKPKTPIEVEK